MAPCSCQLIGWAASLIRGSDSLLLSSEEPSRVKTRQRGPTNYQLTPCFHPPLPPILSLPPFCLCPTHTAVLQDGSCRLTKIATDLINSLLLIIIFKLVLFSNHIYEDLVTISVTTHGYETLRKTFL